MAPNVHQNGTHLPAFLYLKVKIHNTFRYIVYLNDTSYLHYIHFYLLFTTFSNV